MDDYDSIFSSYVEQLGTAKAEVIEWWDALMAAASPSGDFDEAQRAVRPRWPAGPASHPRIIDVFRRHYLAIERLNEVKESQPARSRSAEEADGPWMLSPQALLFERLADEEPELAKFMEYFVFIAIGTDTEGQVA